MHLHTLFIVENQNNTLLGSFNIQMPNICDFFITQKCYLPGDCWDESAGKTLAVNAEEPELAPPSPM